MGGNRKPAANTQGSWFPSGYYGHFRCKHRNDFINEYRQQAKPSPPYKFHDRIADRPSVHHFSHHDNRFSFLNTVTSFEGSLGKRKVQTNYKSKFIPDFIAWVPHKRDLAVAGPNTSVYRETFRSGEAERVPQILVPSVTRAPRLPEATHPKFMTTPFIDPGPAEENVPMATTYQLSHRHQQPNRNVHTNMNTGMIEESSVPEQKTMAYLNPKPASIYDKPVQSMTRMHRLRVASAPVMRASVADCLVWHSHGSEENIQLLPAEKVRPKTVMGLLPELSTSGARDTTQYAAEVPTLPGQSQLTHFGVTPSATATVPMETFQSLPPSMTNAPNINHVQMASQPEPTRVAMEA